MILKAADKIKKTRLRTTPVIIQEGGKAGEEDRDDEMELVVERAEAAVVTVADAIKIDSRLRIRLFATPSIIDLRHLFTAIVEVSSSPWKSDGLLSRGYITRII